MRLGITYAESFGLAESFRLASQTQTAIALLAMPIAKYEIRPIILCSILTQQSDKLQVYI